MAKKKLLTPAEKSAETRRLKQEKAMESLGFERKKVIRKRKPMSPEQKAAAVERLRIAREARGLDGSKSVHYSIRDLPDDHFLHWKKVKQWVKSCSEELKGIRNFKNSKVSKERSEYHDLSVYISNMKKYLTNGVWLDFRYGEQRESKIRQICLVQAYHDDGRPKRTYGTWYPDISEVWTQELENDWGREHDDDVVAEKERLRKNRKSIESEVDVLDSDSAY